MSAPVFGRGVFYVLFCAPLPQPYYCYTYSMELFLYFGIVNLLFIPLALYFLWVRNGKFSLVTLPISYTGTTTTRKHFMFLTSLGAFIELLFITQLLLTLGMATDKFLLPLQIIGFLGIFLTAITPPGASRLHRAGITIMVIAMTFWSLYFHYALLSYSNLIAGIGLILSISTFIGIPYFYYYVKSKGLTELFFIAIVLCWNILMTYFVLLI